MPFAVDNRPTASVTQPSRHSLGRHAAGGGGGDGEWPWGGRHRPTGAGRPLCTAAARLRRGFTRRSNNCAARTTSHFAGEPPLRICCSGAVFQRRRCPFEYLATTAAAVGVEPFGVRGHLCVCFSLEIHVHSAPVNVHIRKGSPLYKGNHNPCAQAGLELDAVRRGCVRESKGNKHVH